MGVAAEATSVAEVDPEGVTIVEVRRGFTGAAECRHAEYQMPIQHISPFPYIVH